MNLQRLSQRFSQVLGVVGTLWAAGASAQPVFNLPFSIVQGTSAIGLVPDLTLGTATSAGVGLRYTYGLTDILNAQVGIGTRSGEPGISVGVGASAELLTDDKGRPGLGVAAQMYNVSRGGEPTTDMMVIPYIHKRFERKGGMTDPFVAVPFWVNRVGFVLGSEFSISEHFRYSAELGMNLNNAATYFSAGLTYDP